MATNTEKVVVQVIVKGGGQLDALTKKTTKATKSAGGLTKSMAKMAAGVFAAAAAFRTISSVIGSSIKTFKDFEFQMAKVKAISGASSGDFLKLSKSAEDLGRTTFFTATQVAELQTNYAKLGFTTKEILNAQEATLSLATATGEDLGRAAIVAGSAVRGFGLDASETQRVVDVMAVSFTSSAMDLEKWQTSMTKVAPIAKSAGFSIEDTAAMMSKLTDSGIEASIAGTSMRNILLAMQDPNSDLTKSFGKTIHSYDELVPAMNKFVKEGGSMAEVMQVVEKRQAASFEQLISNTGATLALRDAMVSSSGAAKDMAHIVGDTLEGAFKRLVSAWQGLMINFTESVVGEGLQAFVDGVADMVNVVSDFMDIPMSEKLEEERIALNSMVLQLTEANIKEDDRNKLITKINKQYPKFLENIDTEKTSTSELRKRLSEYNSQLLNKIALQIEEENTGKAAAKAGKARRIQAKEEIRLLNELVKVSGKHNITLDEGATTSENFSKVKEILTSRLNGLGSALDPARKSLEGLNGFVVRSVQANQNLTKATAELNSATEDRDELAKRLGISLEEVIELEEEETKVIAGGTEEIIKNTKAKKENDMSSFVSTASIGVWDDLVDGILNGTKTMEQAEQDLADFQIGLIKSVLEDENLSFEERSRLTKQLTQLQLQENQKLIENQKITSEQRKAIMQAASDALFTIIGQNAQRQASKDSKALEEKKDAGLISQEEYEEGILVIQKKAFERKKRLDIAQAIINGALAMTTAMGQTGILSFAFSPFIAAMTALQIAVIASQKFAQGGVIKEFANGGMVETFANGGMVQGKSHAQGGEKFAVGGRVVELEGGEAVINKRSTAMFGSQLSAMNAAGGGVKFADGGLLNQPSFSQQQFNALGQNQMMGAMGGSSKVVVVEADITDSQNTVSVIQSQATI